MRMLRFALAVALLLGTLLHEHAAVAQANDKPADGVTADSIATPASCQERLDALHVTFSFAVPVSESECAIPLPVTLQSLSVGAEIVTFSGKPLLDCRLAERLADWTRNVAAPLAVHHLGSGLADVATGPGYVCRKRNNEATGKLSEHAKGDAIDVSAFVLRDGRSIAVRGADEHSPDVAAFLAAIRTTACGYFLTVLGPGSDGAHTEHLHLDLGQHGKSANYRICE